MRFGFLVEVRESRSGSDSVHFRQRYTPHAGVRGRVPGLRPHRALGRSARPSKFEVLKAPRTSLARTAHPHARKQLESSSNAFQMAKSHFLVVKWIKKSKLEELERHVKFFL